MLPEQSEIGRNGSASWWASSRLRWSTGALGHAGGLPRRVEGSGVSHDDCSRCACRIDLGAFLPRSKSRAIAFDNFGVCALSCERFDAKPKRVGCRVDLGLRALRVQPRNRRLGHRHAHENIDRITFQACFKRGRWVAQLEGDHQQGGSSPLTCAQRTCRTAVAAYWR